MENEIRTLLDGVRACSGGEIACAYLYGSAAVGDFHAGWSDIDVLILMREPLSGEIAEKLVHLRQELREREGDPVYRLFEGAILSAEEFFGGKCGNVVYWGTSGQRVKTSYELDVFSRVQLLQRGRLLCGEDLRGRMNMPSRDELTAGVRRHYESIRECAGLTGDSLYSCGWLLDIARCLYTLRTGDVIAKTAAGEWALEEGLCPDEEALRRTLEVRREPARWKDLTETKGWLASLEPTVQRFADVLQAELERAEK